MSRSRSKNVSINVVVALICQIINLVFSFISRTIFIKTLGEDYLGVNGLFTNILSVLSLAELGIGHAIVFSMYKPLAMNDTKKIASLMKLYKYAYRLIALIVAVVGLLIAPFLTYIIKGKPNVDENLTLLYILYLTNTVFSYLLVYKKSILTADQKNYIALGITQGFHILQTIFQICFLYATHNYIIFLVLQIIFTLLGNITASIVADKKYPYLRDHADMVPKDERNRIFANVRGLAMYKIGSVILNGTDNILVSSLVGITAVGLVSNYSLLTSACSSILANVTNAFTASVGNLNAIGEKEKKYDVFNKMLFITSWIYGFASVGLITVVEYLIPVWIGEKYLLSRVCSIAIVLGFYVQGVHTVESTYRTTLGFFKEGRWAPVISAIINLTLSVILCKWIGLAGIFIATPIARASAIGIVDTLLIYKREFKVSPSLYYIKYFGYLAINAAICIACDCVIQYITISGWLGVAIKAIVVSLIYNSVMLIIFHKTKIMKDLFVYLRSVLGNRF